MQNNFFEVIYLQMDAPLYLYFVLTVARPGFAARSTSFEIEQEDNTKDFVGVEKFGIRTITPKELMEEIV